MKRHPSPHLASFLLLAVPMAAQGSILPYLPKDTMMAVSTPNLEATMAKFAQMPMAKMWMEEEVQTFVADLKEMAEKQFEKGMAQAKEMHAQGALPVDPAELMKLRVQGMTMAVTKLEMAMGDFGPQPNIGIVLHLDFGSSTATWTKMIDMGLGLMEAEAGETMQKKESKVGDVRVLSFTPNGAADTPMGLNIAMVPNGILIGSLASDVQSIVESMQKKTPVLGATADYQSTAKHVGSDSAECEMFFRPTPMMHFAMQVAGIAVDQAGLPVDMEGVERAVKAMGGFDQGSSSLSWSYADGKCIERSFTAHNAATKAAPKVVDSKFLKWVPKDAVGFSAGTMDIASIYDVMVKGLEAYDPEFAKQMLAELAEMEKQVGFSIRSDLFGAIGDHYIRWSMPMGTISSAPEMAWLVKVTDEAKLVRSLKNLTKLTDGRVEIEEGEKRGIKAYQLRLHLDQVAQMGGMSNVLDMIQPTFAFKDGYMVLCLSASDVKRVFQRMDREDDPKGDVRSNKEFAAGAASLPAGVESLSFTDWKSDFESMYGIATGLLTFVRLGEEIPVDLSQLPDSATLTKHLFAKIGYTKSDAEGTTSVTTSPFGPEVYALIGAAVAIAGGFATANRGF